MAEPYMPSNGSEGEGFFESFCAHCSRDAAFRETGYEGDSALGCQILAASLRGEQQAEWISDERGSRCTAYTTDPTMPERCPNTPDLFALPSTNRVGSGLDFWHQGKPVGEILRAAVSFERAAADELKALALSRPDTSQHQPTPGE